MHEHKFNQQCEQCGNIVAGSLSCSKCRKFLTGVAKEGGLKAVFAIASSVVPGGAIAGFLAGKALDAYYGDEIDDIIEKIVDCFESHTVYIFSCPKCGNSWCEKIDNQSSNFRAPQLVKDRIKKISEFTNIKKLSGVLKKTE